MRYELIGLGYAIAIILLYVLSRALLRWRILSATRVTLTVTSTVGLRERNVLAVDGRLWRIYRLDPTMVHARLLLPEERLWYRVRGRR